MDAATSVNTAQVHDWWIFHTVWRLVFVLQTAQFWPIRTGTAAQGGREQECELQTDSPYGPNHSTSEALFAETFE